MEGVEHEKSASAAVEEEQGGASVDEDEDWDRPYKGCVSVDEYEKWEGPIKPAMVYYRNDEELARIKKIFEKQYRDKYGDDDDDDDEDEEDDDDCDSEDSDDGDDELRRYKEQIDKSDGFDIDFAISIRFWEAIYPIGELGDGHEKYDGMVDTSVKFAIKNYNEQHQDHEKLELSKVVKANVKICGGYYFYITLEAKNIATSEEKTYQAQVDYVFGHEEDFRVPIFREKPDNVQGGCKDGSSHGGGSEAEAAQAAVPVTVMASSASLSIVESTPTPCVKPPEPCGESHESLSANLQLNHCSDTITERSSTGAGHECGGGNLDES